MTDIEYIRYLRQTAIALKFSFPPEFRRYGLRRLLRCFNGIGAEWMPAKVRGFLTSLFFRLQAAALIHDFEFTYGRKSYCRFTSANVRFAYNSCRSRHPFSGAAGAILCQLFGWQAFRNGRERTEQWNILTFS